MPYLKQVLGFIGITEVAVVHADNTTGANEVREGSLAKARSEIKELAAR